MARSGRDRLLESAADYDFDPETVDIADEDVLSSVRTHCRRLVGR
ncbi:MAG: hypothetical protein A07HN63_00718 [uncultured archaeon A07HN63]|nr:MAG: hypothetical protein A07HN63_00718 [uncultured archaeon A07HN63]